MTTALSFSSVADLGPPSSVKLTSVKGDLEIVIADPLSSTNKSMKTLAPDMYYLIQYWKQLEDYKVSVCE